MMLWIIGYSTLAENIEKRHMGTASGVVSGAVAAGILAGPAVSGFFVEKVGYWFAWSLCFGLVSFPPPQHDPMQALRSKKSKKKKKNRRRKKKLKLTPLLICLDHCQCCPATSYGREPHSAQTQNIQRHQNQI